MAWSWTTHDPVAEQERHGGAEGQHVDRTNEGDGRGPEEDPCKAPVWREGPRGRQKPGEIRDGESTVVGDRIRTVRNACRRKTLDKTSRTRLQLADSARNRLLRREKKLRDETALFNRRLDEIEQNGRLPAILDHFRRENGLMEPCGLPNFCLYSGEDLMLLGKDPVKVVQDLRESAREESTYKEMAALLDQREMSHWSKYSESPTS